MKKEIIKRMRFFLLGAVMLVTIVGCTSNPSAENTSKELTIWAYDSSAEAAQKAVEIFKKNHPDMDYEINVVSLGQDEMVEKVKVGLLGAGDSASLPDLFYDEDYNFNEYMTYYRDEFVNLSSYLSPDDFYDFKAINAVSDNDLYAIPYDAGTGMLLYRIDLLSAAGYSESDMEKLTWDRFIEIGKDVKSQTGVDMIIMCPDGDMEGRLIYQSGGTWFFDETGNVNIQNNDVFRDSFTTIKQLYEADIVYDVAGWDDYINAISNGKMVSLIGAPFWIPIINEYQEQEGLWRFAEIPRMEGNDDYVNYSNLSGGSWFVINNSNRDLAIEFAVEMFANCQELADYMANEYLVLPVDKELAQNLSFKPNDFFGGQNCAALLAEYNEKIIPVKYGLHNYELTYTVPEWKS